MGGYPQMKKHLGRQVAVGVLSAALIAGSVQPGLAAAKEKDHKDKESEVEKLLKPGKIELPNNIKVDVRQHGKGQAQIILTFSDLDDVAWAIPAIAKMRAKNIFQGYADGTFQPNKPITQLEAIITAVRIMGLEDEALAEQNRLPERLSKALKGLNVQSQASGYVAVALENGLLDSDFKGLQPNKPATREWVAVLLVRALGMEKEALSRMNDPLSFRDANAISLGARGYIAVAVEEKLVSGYDDKTFKPDKPVTRAEMAALLARYDDRYNQGDQRKVTGTIEDITNDELTVKKSDGTTITVDISDRTLVFDNNRVISISQLKEGDKVSLVNDKDGKLLYIVLTDKAEQGVTIEDEGVVHHLTLPGRNTTGEIGIVDSDGEVKVYSLADDVDVLLDGDYRDENGDLYDLNDIKVGYQVELKGAGNRVNEINITNERDTFSYEGKITALTRPTDSRVGSLTLALRNNASVTLAYTNDTKVYLGSRKVDVSELRLNDQVSITGNGTTVTTITIQY
jgi:Cu/Ag efflux protein CusF